MVVVVMKTYSYISSVTNGRCLLHIIFTEIYAINSMRYSFFYKVDDYDKLNAANMLLMLKYSITSNVFW